MTTTEIVLTIGLGLLGGGIAVGLGLLYDVRRDVAKMKAKLWPPARRAAPEPENPDWFADV